MHADKKGSGSLKRTYVLVDGSPRYLIGEITAENQWQELELTDPETGSSVRMAKMHIQVLRETDERELSNKYEPIVRARIDRIRHGFDKLEKAPRKATCFRCALALSEAEDRICPACGWIKCSDCKACGCSYRG